MLPTSICPLIHYILWAPEGEGQRADQGRRKLWTEPTLPMTGLAHQRTP